MLHNSNFEKLSQFMQLSSYQKRTLIENYEKYDMTRLVKRGGILYAPYNNNGGIKDFFSRILLGAYGDLIGKDRILAQNQRIKLYASGYYKVCSHWPHYHYNCNGIIMSPDAFSRAIKNR